MEYSSTDFELYILRSMKPLEENLKSALQTLGVDKHEMEVRAEGIRQILRFWGASPAELKEILSPIFYADIDLVGSDLKLYRMSAWPDLKFKIEYHEKGPVHWEGNFCGWIYGCTGKPKTPEPWGFLEDEMMGMFKGIEEVDIWGHYRSYTAYRENDEIHYFLRFGYGLLQEIGVVGSLPS